MEVSDKNLMVFGDECSEQQCDGCNPPHCAVCKHCLTARNLVTLKHSYLEYINRVDYKRIFPPKIVSFYLSEYIFRFFHDFNFRRIDLSEKGEKFCKIMS